MNDAYTLSAVQLDQFAELADLLGKASKLAKRLSKGAVKKNDQSWFWTKEWQAMENKANVDILHGKVKSFDSMEKLLKEL